MQQQLGHYQIKDLLGEGTFASVYRAFDEKFEREVALKILKPVWLSDPEAVERFKRETKTETLIFRWSSDEAQRLLELQKGTVDGIADPDPNDFMTIENDGNLALYIREGLNVAYLGMSNYHSPFDDKKVRQARL